MKAIFATSVISLILVSGSVAPSALGQQGQKEAEKPKAGTTSIRGCLEKGNLEGTYVLTDAKGVKTNVTGTADLGKHVGHTVELTGTGNVMNFKATAIKHIAATCESGTAK